MKKEASVVMLPTDKTDGMLWETTSGQLIHTHVSGKFKTEYKPFNLYIVTDDEIKEGDWCLFFWDGMKDGELGQVGSEPQQYLPSKGHTLNLNLRKIIATTDPKLRSDSLIEDPARPEDNLLIRKGIPKIPQSLIESYCKNPVDKVMIEYWEVCPHYDGKHRGKDCSCKTGFIYEPRTTSKTKNDERYN